MENGKIREGAPICCAVICEPGGKQKRFVLVHLVLEIFDKIHFCWFVYSITQRPAELILLPEIFRGHESIYKGLVSAQGSVFAFRTEK